jgi:oligopeptidase A
LKRPNALPLNQPKKYLTPPNMTNPLLELSTHPHFQKILPEHVDPAITALLAQAQTALEHATSPSVPANYEAMSAVLDVATERLGKAWGVVGHLNSVADSPALRAAYTESLGKVTEFYTQLGASEALYAKYKTIAQSDAAKNLTPPRKRALSNAMRDFVLSGAELQGPQRERYAQIQERTAALEQTYSEHVLDATDSYAYFATETQLVGVPADALAAARAAAQAEDKAGYKITLHIPSYLPVMQYGENRELRQTLFKAYSTRASELGKPECDNSALMQEILALRQEEAALLGYANYAELSVVPKMAQSAHEVLAFLRDLAQRAKPFAQADLAELKAFAQSELNLPDLQAWDMAFASEKLKEKRYAFSEQDVKPYFTEPKVLAGLFRIIETLFEVQIKPDTAEVWHPSVRFFRIERTGQLVGQFYLDPYARAGKRPGAWMNDLCGRWARPDTGTTQTPIAHLVCNYTPPLAGSPALLTHDDVTTLFHEFGHGLHHMLTQVSDMGVAGISGVEWDAVELPSQFMENFCWEWEVLQQMTAHVDTGESLPRALFDKMLAAKNFQSGLQTLRQVELSLFDMRLHAEPGSETKIQTVLNEVRQEVAVVSTPEFNRFQNAFSHIFAGGYSAGYYSYKWAEVLSADAWSAFEETGPLNPDTGRRYRQTILEMGGSRPAMENFKAFRGREPKIDALLRHQGMA